MFADLRPAATPARVLQFVMFTDPSPAATPARVLQFATITDSSPATGRTAILTFAMLALPIARGSLQLVLRTSRDVQHLEWTSAI